MRSADEGNMETSEEGMPVHSRFFLLLLAGFVLVVVGVVVVLVAMVLTGSGSVSGGAVIFIGPFPIVVGAGPDVSLIILVSVILAVLSVVVFLVMNRRMRRVDD